MESKEPRESSRNDPLLRLGPIEFGPCWALVQAAGGVEDWFRPLQFALWCQRAAPWWIGDLLNAGDAEFGEAFSQACEGAVSADLLQRYESVARRVPRENRRAGLSWSAHANVARLSPADQRRVLQLAERKGWSSEQVRVHVQKHFGRRRPSAG